MGDLRCVKVFVPSAQTVLMIMVFLGQVQNYMMRVNLSLLIVDMVKVNTTEENHTGSSKFDWNEWDQGVILSAFSYGYCCTQMIGGRMAEIFGFKLVYGLCLMLTGVLTVISPVVATNLPLEAFMALRVIQGLLEGVTFPACNVMTSRWVEPYKRSSFIAKSCLGTVFGLVITFPLCGALSQAYGWESAFYVNGIITIVWFVFWCFLVFDSPGKHPRIDPEEKNTILTSLGDSAFPSQNKPVPWKAIWTSPPFLGLLVADAAAVWGFYTLMNGIPTYLKSVYEVDIKTNGLLSGLPFMSRYFGAVTLGTIADKLIQRNVLSVTNVRRLFSVFSAWGPAICFIFVAYPPIEISVTFTMSVLCIGMFFNGAVSASYFSSSVDLAPNFAGTLMGITNTFSGGAMGFIVPMVTGAILVGDTLTLVMEWKIIFLLSAGIWTIGNFIYVVLIQGTAQKWNNT